MKWFVFDYLGVFCGLFLAASAVAEEPLSFRASIAPLLLDRCVPCHSARKAEGGYRADTYDELLKAGKSGATPIAPPASPEEGLEDQSSELLRRLVSDDPVERMPADADPLPSSEIDLIRRWIREGAKFDGSKSSELLAFVTPPKTFADPPANYPATIPLTSVAFNPQGNEIYVGGYHEVTVWNMEGALVRRIKNIGQRAYRLRLSPDGTILAVACGEPGRYGEVRLIDLASGEVRSILARSTDVALDLAFRPGAAEIAVASADHLIRIVNYQTQETVRQLASHADWVTAIAWNDDGTRLASASRDKSAKLFDATSGELLVNYQGHGAAVRGVIFLPGGTELMTSSTAGNVHRWKAADGARTAEIRLGGEGYQLIRGEGFAIVPTADRRVLRIEFADNSVSKAFEGHQDWVLSAALSPDQSRLVSGGFDGEVRLWSIAEGASLGHWLAKP